MAETALTIEFHRDEGVLPDAPMPVPMRQALPAWFSAMPASFAEGERAPEDETSLTLRACTPFADAMTSGYALLWPATVRIILVGQRADGAFDVRFEPAQPAILMSHPPKQTPGMPCAAFPILKLMNPWIVRTPPGASCLFAPLFNRPEMQILPFAAVVDTDRFFSPVHLPFLLIAPIGGEVRLERGQPVAQIVPFRRDDWVAVRGEGDAGARAATREVLASERTGAYAKRLRARRSFR